MTLSELRALATRVEIEPPNDTLSYTVAMAFGYWPADPELLWQYWIGPGDKCGALPRWLCSIDAAMSLFPPNWRCNIHWDFDARVVAHPLLVVHEGQYLRGVHRTELNGKAVGQHCAPRAIVAAALRVKAYEMEMEQKP